MAANAPRYRCTGCNTVEYSEKPLTQCSRCGSAFARDLKEPGVASQIAPGQRRLRG